MSQYSLDLCTNSSLHDGLSMSEGSSSVKWRRWSDAAKFFENDLFARVSADELRLQFRDFVRRLGELQKEEGGSLTTLLCSVSSSTPRGSCT